MKTTKEKGPQIGLCCGLIVWSWLTGQQYLILVRVLQIKKHNEKQTKQNKIKQNNNTFDSYTKDALLEEYSIAAQVYNLSSIDLCELARNSVLQSNWEHETKQRWIGENYWLRGCVGNDIHCTNVPDCRLEFRDSLLMEEENFLKYQGYPDLRRHSILSVRTDAELAEYSPGTGNLHLLDGQLSGNPMTMISQNSDGNDTVTSGGGTPLMTPQTTITNNIVPISPKLPQSPFGTVSTQANDIETDNKTGDVYDNTGGVISEDEEATPPKVNSNMPMPKTVPAHGKAGSNVSFASDASGYRSRGNSIRNRVKLANNGSHAQQFSEAHRQGSMRSVILHDVVSGNTMGKRATSPNYALRSLANSMASDGDCDSKIEPPHEKWIELAKERKRLEIIRDEITKFMEANNMKSFDDIKEVSESNLSGFSTPQTSQDNDTNGNGNGNGNEKNNEKNNGKHKNNDENKPKGKNGKKAAIAHQARRLSQSSIPKVSNASDHQIQRKQTTHIVVSSIVGEYFDENHRVNKIDENLTIFVDGAKEGFNGVLASYDKFNDKYHNKHKNNIFIVADLKSQNKSDLIMNSESSFGELFDGNDTASAELDVYTGELIWSTGVVWFKNDWNILKGSWEDEFQNIIEIRGDNTARYLKGYGPFNAEIVGFKQVRIEMPNKTYMDGDVTDVNQIKFENGDKWTRHSLVFLLFCFFGFLVLLFFVGIYFLDDDMFLIIFDDNRYKGVHCNVII